MAKTNLSDLEDGKTLAQVQKADRTGCKVTSVEGATDPVAARLDRLLPARLRAALGKALEATAKR